MLKQRLLTALILIPLVIGLIYAMPTWVIGAVLAAIVILGASEWTKMIPCPNSSVEKQYLAATLVLLLLGYFAASSSALVFVLSLLTTLWWVFVLLWLVKIRVTGHVAQQTPNGVLAAADWLLAKPMRKALVGWIILVPCFVAVVYFHKTTDLGAHYVFFCMSLMWAADSGAYFAGKKWGKNKLAPGVSPGKTLEGVSGGLAAAALWTLIWMISADLGQQSPLFFFFLSMVVAVFSVAGDLFESLFKRIANIKDSGHLLPGHGGVLDRIDSLTAGAPIFALGLLLL